MTGKTRPDTHAGQLRWRAVWGFLATQEGPRRSERVGRAEMSVTGHPSGRREALHDSRIYDRLDQIQ